METIELVQIGSMKPVVPARHTTVFEVEVVAQEVAQ